MLYCYTINDTNIKLFEEYGNHRYNNLVDVSNNKTVMIQYNKEHQARWNHEIERL